MQRKLLEKRETLMKDVEVVSLRESSETGNFYEQLGVVCK